MNGKSREKSTGLHHWLPLEKVDLCKNWRILEYRKASTKSHLRTAYPTDLSSAPKLPSG